MNNFPKPMSSIYRTIRLALVVSAIGLAACSTMQATDTGFLKNRSSMATSQDGSAAYYRSATPVDPHQVRSLSVEWATAVDAGFSSSEKAQLLSKLESAIAREAQALPPIVDGRPVVIRAVITRVESVSPALNVVAAVLLTVPLDRGGAAVEVEVLDAETRQPLASMAYAHFAPLSEFKARFSRLVPAELALNAAAVELAKLMRGKKS
jgi:Protein of unknown function (DUF3313)